MQNTLKDELVDALQLERRGFIAVESVLLGLEYAQHEIMTQQDTVPKEVHDFNNDIILQTLLVDTNMTQLTEEQKIQLVDSCLTHVRSNVIIDKIMTFRYSNGTKMVDVHQYHHCTALPIVQSLAIQRFIIATVYLSSRPVLSVLFVSLK